MTLYYSANSNSFLDDALRANYNRAGTWPDDAIAVTDNEWQTYGSGQPPAGKQRGAEADGRPSWIETPPSSIDALAISAMARINAGYTRALDIILAKYPDTETLSFDKQEKQAIAWNAWQKAGEIPEDEPATPYLDAMLVERPIGKAELVARILDKAKHFTLAHGQATGRRQRLEDEVKEALSSKDRATLETIAW